jgi:hypothetical protein
VLGIEEGSHPADMERVLDATLTLAPMSLARPLAASPVFLAALAIRGHSVLAFGLALAVVAVYGSVFEKRVEFGEDALILRPLLPLRRPQRFSWESLGTPRFSRGYAGFGTIKVPLSDGRYLLAGFLPRASIALTAVYRGAAEGRVLNAAEVAALIQRSRLRT